MHQNQPVVILAIKSHSFFILYFLQIWCLKRWKFLKIISVWLASQRDEVDFVVFEQIRLSIMIPHYLKWLSDRRCGLLLNVIDEIPEEDVIVSRCFVPDYNDDLVGVTPSPDLVNVALFVLVLYLEVNLKLRSWFLHLVFHLKVEQLFLGVEEYIFSIHVHVIIF